MRRRASPPLSYGDPPIGILWWELVTLFFSRYPKDIVSQPDLSCFYSLVKKIITAFFFCGLTGNFLHCCTLWFGWRFLNLFPYSVLSFCILNWIFSTHNKENINSLVEPDNDSPTSENIFWSPFNLSTSIMPSMMRAWQMAGKFPPQKMRFFFLQLICSCYLASFLLWPS